jgi:hypothetical protein
VIKVRETDYDKTYQIGNTMIHIVAAKQTNEQKNQRLAEIVSIIEMIWLRVADDCNKESL